LFNMSHTQHIAWAQVWRTSSLQFPAYNSVTKTQFERHKELFGVWAFVVSCREKKKGRVSRN